MLGQSHMPGGFAGDAVVHTDDTINRYYDSQYPWLHQT